MVPSLPQRLHWIHPEVAFALESRPDRAGRERVGDDDASVDFVGEDVLVVEQLFLCLCLFLFLYSVSHVLHDAL